MHFSGGIVGKILSVQSRTARDRLILLRESSEEAHSLRAGGAAGLVEVRFCLHQSSESLGEMPQGQSAKCRHVCQT